MSGMGNSILTGIDEFRRATGPVVDVRTPSEFMQGHWPGAVNVPLFTDDQRHQVGLTYKQQGRLEAIKLGLQLCGPALARLSAELTGAADRPSAPLRIYCWRGGMRSNSMAWLAGLTLFFSFFISDDSVGSLVCQLQLPYLLMRPEVEPIVEF